jgi:hypothetical protein
MTTDPAAEALPTWQAARREALLANLLRHRPADFGRPGHLDQRIAAWADDLAATWLAAGHPPPPPHQAPPAASEAPPPRNLVITGQVGTGKTWAVWHAAERAVRAGYGGRIVMGTAARLRRIAAPATADPAELTRWAQAGLLVIDDLGAVRLSEWDLDHLMELVDTRWANQRPMVVMSNVTDLRALLGERISSRLAHGALVIELDGPDRRRQP